MRVPPREQRQSNPAKDARARAYCPVVQHELELIGSRWTGEILRVILAGTSRYTEIRDAVDGISDRLLTGRLRELEAEGIIGRSVLPAEPVAVHYQLTVKGNALKPLIQALSNWCRQWSMPTLGNHI